MRTHVRLGRNLLVSLALAAGAAHARAQCMPQWDPNFAPVEHSPWPNDTVFASARYDEGSGTGLFVAGRFENIGDVMCQSIARWDGTQWSTVGDAVHQGAPSTYPGVIRSLAVFDDGSGPKLYAAGQFTIGNLGNPPLQEFARWNGSQWSFLPSWSLANIGYSLCVHDDGSGARLYAASYDQNFISRILRWNGAQWELIGTFSTNSPGQVPVVALASFDDGTGRRLFAGGCFSSSSGGINSNIARWDGTSWSALGTGILAPGNGGVHALRVYNDGTSTRLVVGGFFQQAGGVAVQNVATWDGTNWSAFGSGMQGDVRALATYDDGSGPQLCAGGYCFVTGQPGFGLYRGNGGAWTTVGNGINGGQVETLIAHDDGGGTRLVVGGSFSATATSDAARIAAWDGTSWDALRTPTLPQLGASGVINALTVHDDGSGPGLFAAGFFGLVGNVLTGCVARWNGSAWNPLGVTTGKECTALASFDDGTGRALYVGGKFTTIGGFSTSGIARWNGSAWSPVGGGMNVSDNTEVDALAVFDDGSGPALVAAGRFSTAGGVACNNIARWDGTSWSALGSGIGTPAAWWAEPVYALAIFDDGSGPALYAAGKFSTAGGVAAERIARWDGANWSAVGPGFWSSGNNDEIRALSTFDDGSGIRLYAGGKLQPPLARWDGSSWSELPGVVVDPTQNGINVRALLGFDDGSGRALIITGLFAGANGQPTPGIARWSPGNWGPVGQGLSGTANNQGLPATGRCLAAFDDGVHRDLFVGGDFWAAGGYRAGCISRWKSCLATFERFCAGDGASAACPCANSGLAGHGCENSASTGGAQLDASGLAGDDSFVLHASGELPSALTIFLQGELAVAPQAFGDGLRCVGGHLRRLYVKNASAGLCEAPASGDPSLRARSAALGDVISDGSARHYQAYYRDPVGAFCAPPAGASFNITNALTIRW